MSQCSACHNLCPNITFCAHCSSSICKSCVEKHLVTVQNSVKSRIATLSTLRQKLKTCRSDLGTITATSEGNDLRRVALTADIENATECLKCACERAFERSMGDVTVEEMQGLERLMELKSQLDEADEMFHVLSCQLYDMISEEELHHLVVFQQQASYVLEQVEGLAKGWSEVKDLDRFECWKVSKTFETIGDTLVSMNLVVCDVLQSTGIPARHFSSFQSYPTGVLSSSNELVTEKENLYS